MSADADRLPKSQKALAAIAQASTWEQDRVSNAIASGRRGWIAASVGAAFGLLGLGMGAFQSLRPPPAPYPVVVDRMTGAIAVVPTLDSSSVPALTALDQHNAAAFIRARESYNLSLLQRDYDQVARMTVPETWAPYGQLFAGERALHLSLGDKVEHRVTVVSVRITAPPQASAPGEAVVTFDKTVRSTTGAAPTTARFVATVRYQYRPEAMKRAADRIENPFGYVVTAYRADQELISPPPAAGTQPSQP